MNPLSFTFRLTTPRSFLFSTECCLLWAFILHLAPAPAQAQVTYSGAITQVGSGFISPSGVAVDPSGNIFVSDLLKSSITEIPANGGAPVSIGSGLSDPEGVATDRYGNVYVADKGNNAVKQILASGGYTTINTLGTGFSQPFGVAVDWQGNVYVADTSNSQVKEIVAESGYLEVNVLGAGVSLSEPESVAVDSNLNVYIADRTKTQIVELTASSVYASASYLGSGLNSPRSVSVDLAGNVFVDDKTSVKELTNASGYSTVLTLNSGFNSPAGIAVDPNETIDIADQINARVEKLSFSNVGFTPQLIGSSATIPASFSIASGTTVGKVSIVTQGATALDFSQAGGSTCTVQTYSTQTNCQINIQFNPLAAGVRNGAVNIYDGGGNLLAGVPILGLGVGPQATFQPGTETIAGSGFSSPARLAIDSSGNLFVADPGSSSVKMVPAGGGTPVTIGSGFQIPSGIAVDGSGNVFVSDIGVQAESVGHLYEIPAAGGYSNVITLASGLLYPEAVAVDANGNVYLAASQGTVGEGPLTPYIAEYFAAGGFTASRIITNAFPAANCLAIDRNGNLFISSSNYQPSGAVIELYSAFNFTYNTTITFGSNGPQDMALDAAGNLYILNNGDQQIFEIFAAGGYSSGKTLAAASFTGMAVDAKGNVYFVATDQSQIDKLDLADPPTVKFASTPAGKTSTDSPQTIDVENIGNADLNISSVTYPADFPEVSGVNTDCTASTNLASGTACTLSIDFSPLDSSLKGVSTLLSESVRVTDNTLNGTNVAQAVSVSGMETANAPSLTSPSSSPLAGATQFTWNPGAGSSMFALWIGTSPGTYNLYTSGHVASSVTSETVNIPARGATLYVQLWFEVNGTWSYKSYTFAEASLPSLTSPTSSILFGSTTFTWNPGAGSSMFALWIGTAPATNNVYTSGHVANTVTSETDYIPLNGATLYVSLWYELNGVWSYKSYTFREAQPPSLTSPTSSPLSGVTNFTWSPGDGSSMFALWIGTTQGTYNLYTSGHVANTVTSETATIPANGATIYVRLWYELNGAWDFKDYTFTEAP